MDSAIDEMDLVLTIESNPAYTDICMQLLEFCAEAKNEEEVFAFCDDQAASATQIQSAASLVDMLVRHGGIAEKLFVDGEAYDGTLTDFQTDENLPDDAQLTIELETTEAGRAALKTLQQRRSFAALTDNHPERIPAFLEVIRLSSQGGASTREIQDRLHEMDVLEKDNRGVEHLHASYFTGALESIGALAWNENKWVATDKGGALLQEFDPAFNQES